MVDVHEPADQGAVRRPARWRWWLAFGMAILLPWVAMIGSLALLDAWLPGVVLADDWRLFSSLAFLAGTVAAVGLVFATSEPLPLRLVACGFLLLGGVALALFFQTKSRCGDENPYVGRKPEAVQVAMCG